MIEFLLILAATVAVFGLLAAGLALRQHRHPESADHHTDGGCAESHNQIKCLQCPSRSGSANRID